MTAREREDEARKKFEEVQEKVKSKMTEAMDNLRDGLKTLHAQGSIVHRHILAANKELLQHQIGLIDAGLKQLDEADKEVAAKAPPRKAKSASK